MIFSTKPYQLGLSYSYSKSISNRASRNSPLKFVFRANSKNIRAKFSLLFIKSPVKVDL
jgi:hypothetical protein